MGLLTHWPVFYNLHEDEQFFAFKDRHYHVDVRFTVAAQRRRMGAGRDGYAAEDDSWEAVCANMQGVPVAGLRGASYEGEDMGQFPPHADIIWKSLKCYRADIPYAFHAAPIDHVKRELRGPAGIKDTWSGQVLPKARTGWVCPHKNFPLGQFAPVDGIITCPMHGLQVHAETGRVLGSCPRTTRLTGYPSLL